MSKIFTSVLGILLTSFLGFILLAPVLTCASPGSKKKAQQLKCIYNLRLLDEAKVRWADEVEAYMRDPVDESDVRKMASPAELKCPAGGRYTLGPVDASPACSVPGHLLKR